MEAAYVEAKKGMLKSLANKMYKLEMDQWKKGKGPKPESVKKEMKQTQTEEKKQEKEQPKMSKHVKDMVRGFFKEKKKEEDKDVQHAGFVRRKQASHIQDAPKRKRRRVSKKVD